MRIMTTTVTSVKRKMRSCSVSIASHVCRTCKETHDRFTRSNDHPLIPSDKLSDENYLQKVLSTQAPYCTSHKQEKVRYYCAQCNELACQVCAIVIHQGHHNLQEVDSIVTSAKAQLEELLAKSKYTLSNARNNLEVTKKVLGEIEDRISDLLRKVDARYDEIVKKLQLDTEQLTEKLKGIQDELSAPVKDIEKNISDWLKAMENTQEMTHTILQQNNSWDILDMKSKIVESIERLNADKGKVRVIPSQKLFKFSPANLVVVNKHETSKVTEGNSPSKSLPDDNFIGKVNEKLNSLLPIWLK